MNEKDREIEKLTQTQKTVIRRAEGAMIDEKELARTKEEVKKQEAENDKLKQAVIASQNARLSHCQPALLKHYKQDSEAKGTIVSLLYLIV
jgi:hypothetical protein